MLLQQKSAQMGNILAEQQVNNNNKAKTKQQTQELLERSKVKLCSSLSSEQVANQ